ncbi:MAG TPA: ABC transporter ATP-binding protein [Bacillales bacterium]|nr:ABC transporter ATP-binding protein [Bacillales bacterium]
MKVDPLVALHDVSKTFDRHPVVRSVDLTLERPEIFGLLGPSGAGKTTLVKMIAGIDQANEGTVHVLGEKMPNLRTVKRIGYMAQSDALYEDLTAKENLHFFASLYGMRKRERNERIAEVLGVVDLIKDENKLVRHFSGGMKRRLSLAAALVHQPEVLILDEPTVGIDPVLRKQVWDAFEELVQKGTAILVTTHVMDEAERCDRLAMIRSGRLIASGTPEALKEDTGTASIEEAFLVFGRDSR